MFLCLTSYPAQFGLCSFTRLQSKIDEPHMLSRAESIVTCGTVYIDRDQFWWLHRGHARWNQTITFKRWMDGGTD